MMPRIVGDERWAAMELRRHSANLTWLGRHFRTDKTGPVHHYTQHYQRHFEPLRSETFVLFEIGIGGYERSGRGGASLRMWKQYFPKAQIVGLDLEDKRFVEEERIRVYQGDQSDPELLRHIVDEVGRPRIVIDDGSHFSPHVRASFDVLFPLLERRGYYVIEDTQTSYWPEWQGSEDRRDGGTTMALVKDLIDGLNYEEFLDEGYRPSYTDRHVQQVHCYHNLVIIKKGKNAEGTRKRRANPQRYGRRRRPEETVRGPG
jgi:hypothetical protein